MDPFVLETSFGGVERGGSSPGLCLREAEPGVLLKPAWRRSGSFLQDPPQPNSPISCTLASQTCGISPSIYGVWKGRRGRFAFHGWKHVLPVRIVRALDRDRLNDTRGVCVCAPQKGGGDHELSGARRGLLVF